MKKFILSVAAISMLSLVACDDKPKATPRTVQNPGSADGPKAGGGLKPKDGELPAGTPPATPPATAPTTPPTTPPVKKPG
ncbi:MAG: hypothetical protein K8R92_03970 [Planctomycetes bacterium]|nr:hypothetical protein [Planctomycetota bacterium]